MKKKYNFRWTKVDGKLKRVRKDGKLCKKPGPQKGQYTDKKCNRITKDGKPWGKRGPDPRPEGVELWDKFTCDICGKSGRLLKTRRLLVWHKLKKHGVPLSVSYQILALSFLCDIWKSFPVQTSEGIKW